MEGDRPVLTLYFAPGSSSMAAHIALHEVGVSFEARPLSFRRRENRLPEYLALNPEGKVPTLVVDGTPLTEVAAILFYLARRFPDARLLPRDAAGEAQAVSWMSFAAANAASGPAARARARHLRLSIGRPADRWARLGSRELLSRRYPPVSFVLATQRVAAAVARCLSQPDRPPRSNARPRCCSTDAAG